MEPDPVFVERHTVDVALLDGTRVRIRPLLSTDRDELLRGFDRLSDTSRYRRFFGGMARLTPALLDYLTRIDYEDHFAYTAFRAGQGVGVARYVRLPDDPSCADAAVTVTDDHHRRGIGRALLQALAAAAVENGVRCFRFEVLTDNRPMLELAKQVGAEILPGETADYVVGQVTLPKTVEDFPDSNVYRLLRLAARRELEIRPDLPS